MRRRETGPERADADLGRDGVVAASSSNCNCSWLDCLLFSDPVVLFSLSKELGEYLKNIGALTLTVALTCKLELDRVRLLKSGSGYLAIFDVSAGSFVSLYYGAGKCNRIS